MAERKALVVCCDGTGQKSSSCKKSNIAKIFDILRKNKNTRTASGLKRQYEFFEGIGIDNRFHQITGETLPNHVIQVYAWLSKNYSLGSEIYAFGFSRGAFTVRSLIGFIRQCGLLKCEPDDSLSELIDRARPIMNLYEENNLKKYPTSIFNGQDCHKIENVNFVGIFDTVSGLNDKAEDSHDYFLKGKVDFREDFVSSSLHLMASNITHCFQNTSYHCQNKDRGKNKCKNSRNKPHQEYWLEGDHCDVGGGWEEGNVNNSPTLANKALIEMLKSCPELGLEIPEGYLAFFPEDVFAPSHSIYSWKDMKTFEDRAKAVAYSIVRATTKMEDQRTCGGSLCPFALLSSSSVSSGDSNFPNSKQPGGSDSNKDSSPDKGNPGGARLHDGGGSAGSSTNMGSYSHGHTNFADTSVVIQNSKIGMDLRKKLDRLSECSPIETWKECLESFTSNDVIELLVAIAPVEYDLNIVNWNSFWKCCDFIEDDCLNLSLPFLKLRLFMQMIIVNTRDYITQNRLLEQESVLSNTLQIFENVRRKVDVSKLTTESDFDKVIEEMVASKYLAKQKVGVDGSLFYEKVRVNSLGRTAELGQFYDLQHHKIHSGNIFKDFGFKELNLVSKESLCHIVSNFITNDNMEKKFELHDIDASLAVNITLGVVDTGGSGSVKSLTCSKVSQQHRKSTLLTTVRTEEHTIDLTDTALKPFFNADQDTGGLVSATHFVGGLVYGGKVVLTMTCMNIDKSNQFSLDASIGMTLEKLAPVGSLKNYENQIIAASDSLSDIDLQFEIEYDSKMTESNTLTPKTHEEARLLMNTILERNFSASNGSTGVIIELILYPLSDAWRHMGVKMTSPMSAPTDVARSVSPYICRVLEEINQLRANYEDLVLRVEAHDLNRLLANETVVEVRAEWCEYVRFVDQSKLDIARTIQQSAATESSVTVIHNVTKLIYECYAEHNKKYNTLFDKVSNKYNLVSALELDFGAHPRFSYIGKDNCNSWFKLCTGRECYILTYRFEYISKFQHAWVANLSLFKKLVNRREVDNVVFLVIDLDIVDFAHEEQNSASNISIHHYSGPRGEWLSHDVQTERRYSKNTSFVRFLANVTPSPVSCAPSGRRKVVLKCPLYCGNGRVFEWKCSACKADLEHVENTEDFYCNCGLFPLNGVRFRCCLDQHSDKYVAYQSKLLESELIAMDDRIVSIMFFGDTGVGKTTFINSLANYMKTTHLRSMIDHPDLLIALIHAVYKRKNADGSLSTVEFGEPNSDEVHVEEGKSSVLKLKIYVFYWGTRIIKIIDIPGMNDTPRMKRESIMRYISRFEKIHAFLFLVEAGIMRLSTEFKIWVTQLATTLPFAARANIFFVYTKARGPHFRPDGTDLLLKAFVKEVEVTHGVTINFSDDNQFTVDNSSIEWLLWMRKGKKHIDRDISRQTDIWNHSSRNCRSLLTMIISCKPQNVAETLLNFVRKKFEQLTMPISVIFQAVEENKHILNILKESITAPVLTERELQSMKYVDQVAVEMKPLNCACTVCVHTDCCSHEQYDGMNVAFYKQCELTSVVSAEEGQLKSRHVLRNLCFSDHYSEDPLCSICNHPWQMHMNIDILYEKVFTKVASQKNMHENDVIVKELVIQEADSRLQRLNHALEIIFRVGTYMVVFLEQRDVLGFNNFLGEARAA